MAYLYTPYNNFLYHYWIKTCENAMKNLWIKLWKKHVNCSISHVFSHGFHTFFTGCETIETLWTGHFSQGQNLCETLWKTLWVFNLWKYLWKTRCEKPLNFHSVFHGVENLKTCEQAFFHGQNLWKKLWNGRSLPGSCMLPPPRKKYNVEVWFLFPSQIEPQRMHLSCTCIT